MPEGWRSGAGGPRDLTFSAPEPKGRSARQRWAMGTPTAWIIDHDARGRQLDLSASRWVGSGPRDRTPPGVPGLVSVTNREIEAQAVRRLAARVGRGRMLRCEAAVVRVWVREVAAPIGGQPQEGAGGSVRSVELDAGHRGPS